VRRGPNFAPKRPVKKAFKPEFHCQLAGGIVNKKTIVGTLFVLAVLFSAVTITQIKPADAQSPHTLVVPDDYSSLSSAIANATSGDIILVRDGIYVEQTLKLNTPLTITAEHVGGVQVVLHPPSTLLGTVGGSFRVWDTAIDITANNVKLSGLIVTSDGGDLLVNCSQNVQLTNNTFSPQNMHIYINGDENTIVGNSLYALNVVGSHNTILANSINQTYNDNDPMSNEIFINGAFNVFAQNTAAGIGFTGTQNRVTNNSLTGGGANMNGIRMFNANYNVICNNTISNCDWGIVMQAASETFTPTCFYNIVAGNTVNNSGTAGIQVNGAYNVFSGNLVTNSDGYSGHGLSIGAFNSNASSWNLFVGNAFVRNLQSFGPAWGGGDNTFEGNYWDDYWTLYPNATELDNSAIGDTPYVVYGNVTDYKPLLDAPEVWGVVSVLPEPWATLLSPTFALISASPNPTPTASVPEFPVWVTLLVTTAIAALLIAKQKKWLR
jgi:parallel beta-helix repeat protein